MEEGSRIYFSSPSRQKSEKVSIPAMGIHEGMPPGLIRHGGDKSNYPCLIIFFHTEANVLTPSGWIPARGKIVLWGYEQEHSYGNEKEEWDHSWLRVDGSSIQKLLKNSSLPMGMPLSVDDDQQIMLYLGLILNELRSRSQQDPDLIERLMQVFLHVITRSCGPDPYARPPHSSLDLARAYIETQFTQPFNLKEVARRAHLSPSHFCHSFSKRFGVSPREYGLQLRLQRSVQLLSNEGLAIYQVAEMVGFSDALYYSKLFTKRYGVCPRQYRKQSVQN